MDPEMFERLTRRTEPSNNGISSLAVPSSASGPDLQRFAALVAEACAAACEKIAAENEEAARRGADKQLAVYAKHQRYCATAIRKRFTATPAYHAHPQALSAAPSGFGTL